MEFLNAVGFDVSGTDELMRLCQQVTEEGEIIATPAGAYFRWSIRTGPFRTLEMWMKEHPDGDFSLPRPHFTGATETVLRLEAALPQAEIKYFDGGFRGRYRRELPDSEWEINPPLVFGCPNFDCYDLPLPRRTKVQLCGMTSNLDCFADADEFRASHPLRADFNDPVEAVFSTDFVRGGKVCPNPVSCLAYVTARVLHTDIITNPVTDQEFCWLSVAPGGDILLDLVGPPRAVSGYLTPGCIVNSTIWLSGRVLDKYLDIGEWPEDEDEDEEYEEEEDEAGAVEEDEVAAGAGEREADGGHS